MNILIDSKTAERIDGLVRFPDIRNFEYTFVKRLNLESLSLKTRVTVIVEIKVIVTGDFSRA